MFGLGSTNTTQDKQSITTQDIIQEDCREWHKGIVGSDSKRAGLDASPVPQWSKGRQKFVVEDSHQSRGL